LNAETARHRWLGHSTVLLEGRSSSLAVDPWRWRDEKLKIDLILVTHGHPDHCSEDDLVAASHDRTIAVGPKSVERRLRALFGERVRIATERNEIAECGARIRVLPAEGPARAVGFHPRGDGASYLVEFEESRYLFLGDSVALTEHEGLDPDVAFFAVGGLAVMDPTEAAAAAARVRPKLAVPVHWGDLNGRFDLAVKFAGECAALGVRAAAVSQLA